MKFEELLERMESFQKTWSGSNYSTHPTPGGFKGEISAGENGIIPNLFPNKKELLKNKVIRKKLVKK